MTLIWKGLFSISSNKTKNIEIARHSGFCYGVKRAVETTKKIKKDFPDKNIFILGELIHNSSVIKELDELGIKTVDKLINPAPKNSICIIRSHGASIDSIEKLKDMGYEVIDLTCPDVKKVQDTAMNLVLEGYFLLILGRQEHPEVMAIEQNAKKTAENKENVLVIKDLDELKEKIEIIKEAQKIYNDEEFKANGQTQSDFIFRVAANLEYLNADNINVFKELVKCKNELYDFKDALLNPVKYLVQSEAKVGYAFEKIYTTN